MGVVAGYLLWCRRLPAGPQAIAVTERLVGRQIGPPGRDLVAEVVAMRSAGSPARRSAARGGSAPSATSEPREGRAREPQREQGEQGAPDADDGPTVPDDRATQGANDSDAAVSTAEADGVPRDLGP
jgi:hypothetical protein